MYFNMQDYVIVITVIVLLIVSAYLLYVSKIQYKIKSEIGILRIDHELDNLMKAGDKTKIQQQYLKLALDKLKSPDEEKKKVGLKQFI